MKDSIVDGKRIIYFSGYYWEVSTTGNVTRGPGPNYFSDSKENVWLDLEGKLHLRITQRDNKWYCAAVTLKESFGHSRYLFFVDSRIDLLDKNVVGGLFTYKTDEQEIDIEFSRWGIDGNPNGSFAVQPSFLAGNSKSYQINLNGTMQTTHWFDWQAKSIEFASFTGHSETLPAAANILQHWNYTGANIPPVSDEKLKINLWLFKGLAPSDLQESEMVISEIRILGR